MKSIKMIAREIISKTTQWIEEYDGAVRIIYSGHTDDEPEFYVLWQTPSPQEPQAHNAPSTRC